MLIDTHCHLTMPELAGQVDDVLGRAAVAGVQRVITVATSVADAHAALELMRTRPQVSLAAAIHPHDAGKASSDDLAALAALHHGAGLAPELASRLLAVGETGLDFHYDFSPRRRQEEVFRLHLDLASRAGRPVVIHARAAEARVCDILDEFPPLAGRVVFHCFSADVSVARRILDQGNWLSFTGVVTFKNAETVRESARFAPLERILVETDAPYLSPVPVRNVRPCEPAFVAHTAKFLAQLRNEPFEAFAAATTANARRFFGLGEADGTK